MIMISMSHEVTISICAVIGTIGPASHNSRAHVTTRQVKAAQFMTVQLEQQCRVYN